MTEPSTCDQASAAPSDSTACNRNVWRRLIPFVALSVLFLALWLLPSVRSSLRVDTATVTLREFSHRLGIWVPLAIAVFAVVSPLAFMPRWPIAFLCGMLYGVVLGGLLANVVSAIGAWIQFRLARHALGRTGERHALAARWRAALSTPRTAFVALFLLRAFPFSNSSATNILAGALSMRGSVYLAATFLGMIPSTLLYACWGKLLYKPSPRFSELLIGLCVFLVIGTLIAGRRILRHDSAAPRA